MDECFSLTDYLNKYGIKHKCKPSEFGSVSEGVQKRLKANIQQRKSTRLTIYDSLRNLPRSESPAPSSEAQQKSERTRLKLEKWKLDKEQKKNKQGAQKKKPFLSGVARAPLKFVPPSPVPSKSAKVTPSQNRSMLNSSKAIAKTSTIKFVPSPRGCISSFAPKNASFKPPQTLATLPKLVPPSKFKTKKANMISFEPVIHNEPKLGSKLRSRPTFTWQNAVEIKPPQFSLNSTTKQPAKTTTKANKVTTCKVSRKLPKKQVQSCSSSSDIEPITDKVETPRKSIKKSKPLTPKVLAMQSSLDDHTTDSSCDRSKRKTLRYINAVKDIEYSSDKCSMDNYVLSSEELSSRNSLSGSPPLSPWAIISTSSDRMSSDDKFVAEKFPLIMLTPATPKKRIPRGESGSKESTIDLPLTSEQVEAAKFIPCVTMMRGKENARKEMKWKIDEGLLDDDCGNDSVEYFRRQK